MFEDVSGGQKVVAPVNYLRQKVKNTERIIEEGSNTPEQGRRIFCGSEAQNSRWFEAVPFFGVVRDKILVDIIWCRFCSENQC